MHGAEHLVPICEKLMAAAKEFDAAAGAPPPRSIPKQLLPSSSDRPHNVNEFRDDSISFFILDSLKCLPESDLGRAALISHAQSSLRFERSPRSSQHAARVTGTRPHHVT